MKAPRPLILIVGSTGTGKSELAVALASRFNGEVINGDALQLYKGLPIVTNKLPEPQRKGVPHHLLGCVGLDERPWTVRQFQERARSLISDIKRRDKLPIIVGGTHYYVQSLLPAISTILESQAPDTTVESSEITKFPILNATTSEIFSELKKLDPTTAARTHPKDRRKVQRGLEICLENGRPASQIFQERIEKQSRPTTAAANDESQALPDDLLIFWTHATAPNLNPRLDDRIDRMISQGLLEEVESVHQYAQDLKDRGIDLDQTHGIWTAIGYKEFLPFITQPERSDPVKEECTERVKIATRQYAKRQSRWIRLTLLPALSGAEYDHRIYPLDASEISHFAKLVLEPALRITGLYLDNEELPHPRESSAFAAECLEPSNKPAIQARHCDVCDKTLMTEGQWKAHLDSKGHRSAIRPKIDWKALHENLKSPT